MIEYEVTISDDDAGIFLFTNTTFSPPEIEVVYEVINE
jgi:hypothetical protein